MPSGVDARAVSNGAPDFGRMPAYLHALLQPERPISMDRNLRGHIFLYTLIYFYIFLGPLLPLSRPGPPLTRPSGRVPGFGCTGQQKYKTLKLTKVTAQRTIPKVLFHGLERV